VKAYIKAISYYLPNKVLSNQDLARIYPDLNSNEIKENTKVELRHISNDDEIGSDLGFMAAKLLFENYSIDKNEIDFLLFCSEGLDYSAPSTACILQNKLDLSKHIGSLDIPYGCSGFIYGLSVAKGLIESQQAKNILLITADTPSKVIHPEDFELRLIFGDAGAATLISSRTSNGIGKFKFGTDGSGYDKLIVRKSGIRERMTVDWLEKYKDIGGMPLGRMEMKSSDIFLFAMKVVPRMVSELLQKEELEIANIDFFVFHQANYKMLEVLRKKLKIPKEKFIIDIEDVGNTVSASIPIAFSRALNSGKIQTGDHVMLCGFGIGLSWCGTIVQV
jgi:3-oxoacyl-[acyl-carrier-protein] synthase-3